MATVTRLGTYGGPRQRYGSFAGKESDTSVGSETHTRLGAHGGPRQRYGSFAGKELEDGVIEFPKGGGSNNVLVKRRMRAAMLQHEEREMAGLAMIVLEAINEIS